METCKMVYRKSFSFDKETDDFLDAFNRKYKISKSLILRTLVQQYIEKPKELFKLITGEENNE